MKHPLPKTHALLKRGIRVKSITRNETLIKQLIKNSTKEGDGVNKWVFPEF